MPDADHDQLRQVQRPAAVTPDYSVPIPTDAPAEEPGASISFMSRHRMLAGLLRAGYARTRRAFTQTPWEIDRIFGLGVFGLGIVFHIWPAQVVHFGFRFLGPVIDIASWLVMAIGLGQMVVGIMEWGRTRQVAAFACFFVYAAISRNNDSPSGEWMYGVAALAEALIVLKRY